MKKQLQLRNLSSVIQTTYIPDDNQERRTTNENELESVGPYDGDNVELKGHLEYERDSLIVLLEIEKEFRKYYELYCEEVKKQLESVEILRNLTMSYIARTCSADGCQCVSPTEYANIATTIKGIAIKYDDYCQFLRESNRILMFNLKKLRPNLLKFRSLTSNLNKNIETEFMIGDAFHKPISYFVELVNDIFKYMHSKIIKLDCQLLHLDPHKLDILEDYINTLQRSEEFEEHLFMRLIYCQCLSPKPICPIVRLNTDTLCEKLQKQNEHIKLRLTLNINRQMQCFQKFHSIMDSYNYPYNMDQSVVYTSGIVAANN